MIIFGKQAVLLIVYVQKAFDDPSWEKRNNHEAEENMSELLRVSLPQC